ncbi:MAG: hypothetical protein GY703_15995 [Gammaproteobacteria bacterium]|nr:hypothetical protein [Gammaproteobacteria bacterium]
MSYELTKFHMAMIILVLLAAGGQVIAAGWEIRDPHDHVPNHIKEYEWEEGEADLPNYPQEENLLPVQLGYSGSKFSYFVDSESLQVGEDGVVRYTLVIRSKSGASNVMSEGIQCSTRTYKTYAYGGSKGKFSTPRNPKWRPIRATGSRRYRYDLWSFYFCTPDGGLRAQDRQTIVRAIKYPEDSGRQ